MSELKTKPNDASVEAFLNAQPAGRREDCIALLHLMERITGAPAKMWGPAIVGFGSYHYKYASGQEGDWFVTGFSPRKQNLTLYIMSYLEQYPDLMARLGKFKTGKACLYIKQLADVDPVVLEALIRASMGALLGGSDAEKKG